MRGVVTGGALGLGVSTGSVGAAVEGNGIPSVSTLAGLSPGVATARLLTWSK